MGNALFALFLTLICETVFGMIFAAPAAVLIAHEGATLNELVFAGLLVFCALVVWLLFQYGFHTLILRMVRSEYVTLGFVFYGFKTIKKTYPLVLSLAVLISVVTGVFVVVGRIVVAKLGLSVEQASALSLQEGGTTEVLLPTGILLGAYALLLVIVFIRFVFVFYVHADNPDEKISAVFKKSALLMRKKVFRLIRLVLRAGGRNLVIAILTFALTMLIPATNEDGSRTGLSIAVLLFNFVYFVNAYTALLRMYFAFPILYVDALQPTIDVTITDEENSEVLADTVALLSDKEDHTESE